MKNYFIYSYFSSFSTLAHLIQTKRHLTKSKLLKEPTFRIFTERDTSASWGGWRFTALYFHIYGYFIIFHLGMVNMKMDSDFDMFFYFIDVQRNNRWTIWERKSKVWFESKMEFNIKYKNKPFTPHEQELNTIMCLRCHASEKSLSDLIIRTSERTKKGRIKYFV